MAGISQNVRALVDRNARGDINSNTYEREYRQPAKRYEDLGNQLKGMEAECKMRKMQRSAMARFLKSLKRTATPVNDFYPSVLERSCGEGHHNGRRRRAFHLQERNGDCSAFQVNNAEKFSGEPLVPGAFRP